MMLASIMVFKIRDKISVNKLIILLEIFDVSAAVIMGVSTLFENVEIFCMLSCLSRFL